MTFCSANVRYDPKLESRSAGRPPSKVRVQPATMACRDPSGEADETGANSLRF